VDLKSITPDWLTSVLRRTGAVRAAAVSSVQIEPVAVGVGLIGQSAVLRLHYDRQEQGAPASLFCKLSSADAAVRQRLRLIGLYECEAGFYRELAPTVNIRVPRCYLSHYDHADASSILLLEDIGKARFGDSVAGCSKAEATLVIERVAALHATWWNHPRLDSFDWLRIGTYYAEAYRRHYQAMLPRFEAKFHDVAKPLLLAVAHDFQPFVAAAFRWLDGPPRTITHGDLRLDNLAFECATSGRDLLLFDWQATRITQGPLDLAYFLALGLPVEQRRATEPELLATYHSTLRARGIHDYPIEAIREAYRRGLAKALIVTVNSAGLLDATSVRGHALIAGFCERVAAALADHDFAALLDDRCWQA
jgi:hypothetical protein